MTLAIVPAAGASRRMGAPKLLLPFEKTTIVHALVAALRAGGASPVVLVTAPDDEEMQRTMVAAGCRVVVNPAPERGMLSTIREGIASLGGAKALAERGEVLLVGAHTSRKAYEYRFMCITMHESRAPPLWYSLRLK